MRFVMLKVFVGNDSDLLCECDIGLIADPPQVHWFFKSEGAGKPHAAFPLADDVS